MRIFFIALTVAILALTGAAWWKYHNPFPLPSQESVQLNAEKRHALMRLKDEKKFEPHDFPPLGYTDIATPEEGRIARAAVNDVIETILLYEDGPVAAPIISALIEHCMKRVDMLETEDRDRVGRYMIEIWYLLGFKGSTGQFAHGAAFDRPAGYAEPLPPGWKSPTAPRSIGLQ